jgi:hypothetical protein
MPGFSCSLVSTGLDEHSPFRVDVENMRKKAVNWDSDWGTVTLPWVMAIVDNQLVRRSTVLRKDMHT